jgi:hypothetical protein
MSTVRASEIDLQGDRGIERKISFEESAELSEFIQAFVRVFGSEHHGQEEGLFDFPVTALFQVKPGSKVRESDRVDHLAAVTEIRPYRTREPGSQTIASRDILPVRQPLSAPWFECECFSGEAGSLPSHTSAAPVFVEWVPFSEKSACSYGAEYRAKRHLLLSESEHGYLLFL